MPLLHAMLYKVLYYMLHGAVSSTLHSSTRACTDVVCSALRRLYEPGSDHVQRSTLCVYYC
jgi:hypothetical protein